MDKIEENLKNTTYERQTLADKYQKNALQKVVDDINIEVLSKMNCLSDTLKENLLNNIYMTDSLELYKECITSIKFWSDLEKISLMICALDNSDKDGIYQLIFDVRNNFNSEEFYIIVRQLCLDKEFDIILNIVNDLNYLLSKDAIIDIVELMTMYDDPYELLSFIIKIYNQLSENQLSALISKLCDIGNASVILDAIEKLPNISEDDYKECIITILETKNEVFINRLLDGINLDILSSDDILYIIYEICGLKNVDCILNMIIKFIGYLNENHVYELVKCADENGILTLQVLAVINKRYFDLLNEDSINIILKSAIKSKNHSYISYVADVYKDKLTPTQISDYIDGTNSIGESLIIIKVITSLNDKLSSKDIEKVGFKLCDIGCAIHIYQFSSMFYDRIENKKLKERIILKMLELREIKYIILMAVFIEISLIDKLFKNASELCLFAISSKLFDSVEIEQIKKKLNVIPEEPNIDGAVEYLKARKKDSKNLKLQSKNQ